MGKQFASKVGHFGTSWDTAELLSERADVELEGKRAP
jgi:hypothetical protein